MKRKMTNDKMYYNYNIDNRDKNNVSIEYFDFHRSLLNGLPVVTLCNTEARF